MYVVKTENAVILDIAFARLNGLCESLNRAVIENEALQIVSYQIQDILLLIKSAGIEKKDDEPNG